MEVWIRNFDVLPAASFEVKMDEVEMTKKIFEIAYTKYGTARVI